MWKVSTRKIRKFYSNWSRYFQFYWYYKISDTNRIMCRRYLQMYVQLKIRCKYKLENKGYFYNLSNSLIISIETFMNQFISLCWRHRKFPLHCTSIAVAIMYISSIITCYAITALITETPWILNINHNQQTSSKPHFTVGCIILSWTL